MVNRGLGRKNKLCKRKGKEGTMDLEANETSKNGKRLKKTNRRINKCANMMGNETRREGILG